MLLSSPSGHAPEPTFTNAIGISRVGWQAAVLELPGVCAHGNEGSHLRPEATTPGSDLFSALAFNLLRQSTGFPRLFGEKHDTIVPPAMRVRQRAIGPAVDYVKRAIYEGRSPRSGAFRARR